MAQSLNQFSPPNLNLSLIWISLMSSDPLINKKNILVLYHDGDRYLPKLAFSLWTWHDISCRQKCPARTDEERKVKNGRLWDLNILALKCTKLEHVCRGGFEISSTSTLLSQPSRSASGPAGLPAVKGAAMCFFSLLTCTCVPTHTHTHALIITRTCCQISQEKRVNIKCEIASFLLFGSCWSFDIVSLNQVNVKWLDFGEAYN